MFLSMTKTVAKSNNETVKMSGANAYTGSQANDCKSSHTAKNIASSSLMSASMAAQKHPSSIKRVCLIACSLALVVFAILSLSACGEQIAATWAHGEIEESDITTRIENMRTSATSTGTTTWDDYIKKRSYNSDATDEQKEAADGTVAEMREYVIKELIKNKAVINEAEEKGYTVSDEELDAYVEEKRTEYESTYASGMSGTFESILRQMGYKSVSAFREASIDTLKERKVQEAVTGKNDTADDFDEDAWKNHEQELYDNSNVHINDKPDNLSYDPDSSSYKDDDSSSSSSDTTNTETSSDSSSEGEGLTLKDDSSSSDGSTIDISSSDSESGGLTLKDDANTENTNTQN